jgi:hypothetical protein
MTNTQSLGIRIGLSDGLPKWFPLLWRHWIRTEDVAGIRFVLSFCYVYKAFEPGTIPNLSTITQDPWYGDPSDFSRFAGKLLSKVRGTLKPLHHLLMGLLKLFPQDATFAQDSALRSFANMDYKHIWSLDLKAATDTIPQQLYRAAMVYLIGVRLADLWVDLLCSRRYDVVKGCPMGKTDESVSYTRGQPVGALSSWPAMALVHHVIVLYAAPVLGSGY